MQARRERRHEDALRLAETVETAFGTLSAAGRRLRLHTPELVEKGYTQVLNATFLVPDHRGAELQVLARTLRNTTGARIDVSGPWVPYSFVGEV